VARQDFTALLALTGPCTYNPDSSPHRRRARSPESRKSSNRRGEPLAVPVALTERADGDRQVLAADLTLAPLADGDYVIEVTASSGGGKIQKLLAFRVVR